MTLETDYESESWLDIPWSAWHQFRPLREMPSTDVLTTEPGLYRVRHDAFDQLVYIGETGRSTRGRVGALARGTFAEEMPFRDPHTAAPTLWAIREEHGPAFELSWTTPKLATGKQARKGIEAALIALHRQATNRSPVANFGRIIPGYKQSGYSRDGEESRGGPLAVSETEPNAAVGAPPPSWIAPEVVTGPDWLDLGWAAPVSLKEVAEQAPTAAGIYRLWKNEDERLTYVGESQGLRARLKTHRRTYDTGLLACYATLPDRTRKHELLEIETDLLGAHWLATGTAPLEQF